MNRVKSLRRVVTVFAVVSGAMMTVVMILIVIDVLMRQMTGGGLPAVVDVGELALPIIVYLGIGYTFLIDGHISTTVLVSHFPALLAARLRAAGLTVALGVLLWMTYESGIRLVDAIITREYGGGTYRLLVWPSRLAMLLGLLPLCALIAQQIVELWRGRHNVVKSNIVGFNAAERQAVRPNDVES